MNTATLKALLADAWDPEDDSSFRNLVTEAMQEDRLGALEAFVGILGNLPGEHRLKLLETLSEDGGKDLVPIFIETIRREPNLDIAASVLSLYERFEHHTALEAFLALEGEKRPELEQAWRKTVAALKVRFKEHYTMYQYRMGRKDPDLAVAVAEEIIAQPHRAYLPFLNKEISEGGIFYRLKGVEILVKIGNVTSFSPLLRVLSLVFHEDQRCADLFAFLTDPNNLGMTNLLEFLRALGAVAGWDESVAAELIPEIKREKVWTTLRRTRESFCLTDSVFWQEASRFMRSLLLGRGSDGEARAKLKNAFSGYMAEQDNLIETICQTLGVIGNRCEVVNLYARLEVQLPDTLASRETLLVCFMSGYRSVGCRRYLLDLLDTAKPAPFLMRVLDVLSSYQYEDVPPEILEQVVNPKDIAVRRKAQGILARCKNAEAALGPLLAHPSPDIRGYTVAMIATHRMETGYPKLLAQLNRQMPTSLLDKIIDTLGLFKFDNHASALAPFLVITLPVSTRRAALKAILSSTEPKRLILVLQALQKYQPASRLEMVEEMLAHLASLPAEELPPGVTLLRDFWEETLSSTSETIRGHALTVLERTDWSVDYDVGRWKKLLVLAKARHKDLKKQEELKRLDQLTLIVVGAEEKVAPEGKTRGRSFAQLLDKLEAATDSMRGWRHISLVYKPAMLDAEPDQEKRFYDLVCDAVSVHLNSPKELRFLCALAAKTERGELAGRVRSLVSTVVELKDEVEKIDEPGPIHRIMLLDDSQVILMALKRTLEKAGFTVVSANNPKSGLEVLASESFDLIVIDYFMPEKDGVTLLKEAREMGCAPPCTIFITSTRDGGDLKKILAIEPNGLLLKPFPVDTLLAKIAEIESGRRGK